MVAKAHVLAHAPITTFTFTKDELEGIRQSNATKETLPDIMEDLKDDQFIEDREAVGEAVFRDSVYYGLIEVRKDTIKSDELRIQELADKITAHAEVLRGKIETHEFAIKLLGQVKTLATPLVGVIMGAAGGAAGAILGLGAFFAATSGVKKTLEDQVSVITSPSKDVKDLELTLPENAEARDSKKEWYIKCEELHRSYKSGERKDLKNNHTKANSIVKLLTVLNQNDVKEAKLQKVCVTDQQRIAELRVLEELLNQKVNESGLKKFFLEVFPTIATNIGTVFAAILPSSLPDQVNKSLEDGEKNKAEAPAEEKDAKKPRLPEKTDPKKEDNSEKDK